MYKVSWLALKRILTDVSNYPKQHIIGIEVMNKEAFVTSYVNVAHYGTTLYKFVIVLSSNGCWLNVACMLTEFLKLYKKSIWLYLAYIFIALIYNYLGKAAFNQGLVLRCS